MAALRLALAHRPERDGEAFTEATDQLCRMRESLIRSRAAQPILDRLNGIISCAISGHFPLGNTPWPLLESAEQALRELMVELKGR